MKIMAFNGSPRENWNTATLLKWAVEGAASQGAETKLIHLNNINFKGCVSCFSCKAKGGKSYGKCAFKDELTPILEEIEISDGLLLGSPIYLGAITSAMKAFMERLIYPYLAYTVTLTSLYPKKINTGFIYTMNCSEEWMKQFYTQHIGQNDRYLRIIFGDSEALLSFDTYQFDDYSKVVADRFDPEKKLKRREEIFPRECEKAYEMGVRIATRGNRSALRKT